MPYSPNIYLAMAFINEVFPTPGRPKNAIVALSLGVEIDFNSISLSLVALVESDWTIKFNIIAFSHIIYQETR